MRAGHGVRLALLGVVLACATAGCGLKGPLSLPEKSGEVITRGPQDPAAQPSQPSQPPQQPPPPPANGEAQGGQP